MKETSGTKKSCPPTRPPFSPLKVSHLKNCFSSLPKLWKRSPLNAMTNTLKIPTRRTLNWRFQSYVTSKSSLNLLKPRNLHPLKPFLIKKHYSPSNKKLTTWIRKCLPSLIQWKNCSSFFKTSNPKIKMVASSKFTLLWNIRIFHRTKNFLKLQETATKSILHVILVHIPWESMIRMP